MRSLTKIAGLAAILGGVTAIAAPDATPQTAPPPTVAEMIAEAAAIEGRLEADTKYVLHLQAVAKKQKDVIKLTCVNDKLVQLKAQRNITTDTNNQLQRALQEESDERITLFAELQQGAEAIAWLREEAQACVGETELFKQESGAEVQHPEIVDEPPVGPTTQDIEPPAYASAFR